MPLPPNKKAFVIDAASFNDALKSNRELQEEIQSQLERIRREREQNRQRAAQLSRQLLTLPSISIIGRAESDPCCDWNAHFFQGPDGSTPVDCHDAKRRKTAEALFASNHSPAWSKQEIKQLQAVVPPIGNSISTSTVTTSKRKSTRQQTAVGEDSTVDFDLVAQKLLDSMKRKNPKYKLQRCPQECRDAFVVHCKPPFTTEETENLSKIIGQESSVDSSMDWAQIATKLSSDRTAWECFCQYQRKIKGRPQQPWTRLQDELLFKYVAALGPQVVIDGNEADFLLTGLFRDKTKQQIFTRINNTLLNPNLKHLAWNEREERSLGIGMKIYSDQPKNALYLAGTHILGRANASVTDKWNRSLNPEYSARPFTKEEDEALLKAFRENPNCGWQDMQRFFPDRSSHRLMNRWSEIASDEDILRRCGDSLLGFGQNNHKTQSTQASQQKEDRQALLLATSDLVVQVRKRKG